MDISSEKYAGITQWETSFRTEGPDVPYFFVGDVGFALNRNILRPFGGSNLSVKKECTATACAENEDTWNVLLEFWAINGEFSSKKLLPENHEHNSVESERVIQMNLS